MKMSVIVPKVEVNELLQSKGMFFWLQLKSRDGYDVWMYEGQRDDRKVIVVGTNDSENVEIFVPLMRSSEGVTDLAALQQYLEVK